MTEITKDEMRDRLGNIDQIRDLLFGDRHREYDQRFEQLESKLSSLQQDVRDRLNQLNDALSADLRAAVDSLEKKIKYLSLTTHEEVADIRQIVERTEQKAFNRIDELERSLNTKSSALKEEIVTSKNQLQQDVNALKAQVFAELESRFGSLKDSKLARDDMAEILFELCMKVKGSEFVPDLKEASERQIKADFLLPEQNEERNSA